MPEPQPTGVSYDARNNKNVFFVPEFSVNKLLTQSAQTALDIAQQMEEGIGKKAEEIREKWQQIRNNCLTLDQISEFKNNWNGIMKPSNDQLQSLFTQLHQLNQLISNLKERFNIQNARRTFYHDIAHLRLPLQEFLSSYAVKRNRETQIIPLPNEAIKLLDLVIDHSEAIIRLQEFPYLVYAAEYLPPLPGQPVSLLNEIVLPIALLAALRFSRPDDFFGISINGQNIIPSKNQINIVCQPDIYVKHEEWPTISASIYNLVKNAGKILEKKGVDNKQINIDCRLKNSQLIIDVADNGPGIDLNQCLENIRETGRVLDEPRIDNRALKEISTVLGPNSMKIIRKWMKDALAIRKLPLSTLFDTLLIQRLLPSIVEKLCGSITGSIGLFSVRRILRRLSGKITPTNVFEGGACFRISIPAANVVVN